jgi:hypothetical protein
MSSALRRDIVRLRYSWRLGGAAARYGGHTLLERLAIAAI